jgi:hypothetical protein
VRGGWGGPEPHGIGVEFDLIGTAQTQARRKFFFSI